MAKRKGGAGRLPQTFDAITLGEQGRWSGGNPCIKEADVELEPGYWGLVWPSWEVWAKVYGECREAFLAECAERHLPAPDSERLYEAILAGEDPEEVQAELRREEAENDPRRKMGWYGPAVKGANDG